MRWWRDRSRLGSGDLAEQIPEEAGEFASEGHIDLRLHHAAVDQVPAALVQPHLGFPAEFALEGGLSLLAQRERC
jgi:hypothetical protein